MSAHELRRAASRQPGSAAALLGQRPPCSSSAVPRAQATAFASASRDALLLSRLRKGRWQLGVGRRTLGIAVAVAGGERGALVLIGRAAPAPLLAAAAGALDDSLVPGPVYAERERRHVLHQSIYSCDGQLLLQASSRLEQRVDGRLQMHGLASLLVLLVPSSVVTSDMIKGVAEIVPIFETAFVQGVPLRRL